MKVNQSATSHIVIKNMDFPSFLKEHPWLGVATLAIAGILKVGQDNCFQKVRDQKKGHLPLTTTEMDQSNIKASTIGSMVTHPLLNFSDVGINSYHNQIRKVDPRNADDTTTGIRGGIGVMRRKWKQDHPGIQWSHFIPS